MTPMILTFLPIVKLRISAIAKRTFPNVVTLSGICRFSVNDEQFRKVSCPIVVTWYIWVLCQTVDGRSTIQRVLSISGESPETFFLSLFHLWFHNSNHSTRKRSPKKIGKSVQLKIEHGAWQFYWNKMYEQVRMKPK